MQNLSHVLTKCNTFKLCCSIVLALNFSEKIKGTVNAVVAAAKTDNEGGQFGTTAIERSINNDPGQFGAGVIEMFGEVIESETNNDNNQGQFGAVTSELPADLGYDIGEATIADGTNMVVEESTCMYSVSPVARKPAFRVSNKVQHKSGCTATEDG